MPFFARSRMSIGLSIVALLAVVASLVVTGALNANAPKAHASQATASHTNIDCSTGVSICTEVQDSEGVFGHYVGHDEPSNLFYSNVPGSGNQNRWQLTLPKDPTPTAPLTPGKSFNFELHPAFWFGMAMCDTQSYPELVSTCTPDSDTNIVDPTVSPNHPGTAFTEMQFYPPGWVKWPAASTSAGAGGTSCDATKWCAALNIDSLSQDQNGVNLNPTCAAITGVEYVNFAFITKNGHTQAPANPVQSNQTTFTPDPNKDLFMNSGDKLLVTMHDTTNGLQIIINDQTTGQSGSMTASAANGFGQVKYAPTGTSCTNIPYNFHPMYSTSSEKTRVIWAAHTYNIAFSDEIGHFDYCNGTTVPSSLHGVACPNGNTEGIGTTTETAEGAALDDANCFPASRSSLVQVPGCTATNTGVDGVSYLPVWPDGNTTLHPTSVQFSSPLTGANYTVNYTRSAFEVDLPAIESQSAAATCDVISGTGCTLIPATDDCFGAGGTPPCTAAAFYPFYSTRTVGGHCVWQLGNHIPGSTNDFHQNQQYGTIFSQSILIGGGASLNVYENFRQIFTQNPCKA
nr:hypothetical protein [Ktedonobacteraceae bacterium]